MRYSIFRKLCSLLRWEDQYHFYLLFFFTPRSRCQTRQFPVVPASLWVKTSNVTTPLLQKKQKKKTRGNVSKNNDLWFPLLPQRAKDNNIWKIGGLKPSIYKMGVINWDKLFITGYNDVRESHQLSWFTLITLVNSIKEPIVGLKSARFLLFLVSY